MIARRGKLPMICGVGSIVCLLGALCILRVAAMTEDEVLPDRYTWPHFDWILGSILAFGCLLALFATWKHSKVWSFVVLVIVGMFIMLVGTGNTF